MDSTFKDNLPLIEKYRPETLDQVISHDNKIEVLKKAIPKREITHLILHGSPGTGKTSTAIALVRTIYGEQYRRYLLELNASDERGIDVVRNNIKAFAQVKKNDKKFILLDEADSMTPDAQKALKRIMEDFSRTCVFILSCNQLNKIIPAIISRCTPMRFGFLSKEALRSRLLMIIDKEEIDITSDAIDMLVSNQRDFRFILNTIQCLKSLKLGQEITEIDVIEYLGRPTKAMMDQIINSFKQGDFKKSYNLLLNFHRANQINLTSLVEDLLHYLIDHQDDLELEVKSKIIEGLAQVDYRISTGNDTEIQLAGLVAIMIGKLK